MRYSLFNMRHFEQTIYRSVCLRAVGGWSDGMSGPSSSQTQGSTRLKEVEALGHTDNIPWAD